MYDKEMYGLRPYVVKRINIQGGMVLEGEEQSVQPNGRQIS